MTGDLKKYFPIKTEPSCLLKWAWSSIYFSSGSSSSCHRVRRGLIDPNNFDGFHNVDETVKARTKMLNGQWPGWGCESCKKVEDAGGVSDRIHQFHQQIDYSLVPPELLNDPTAVNVTPTIVEVYFKNTCNMACVYCGPQYSSLWEEENRKFNVNFEKVDNGLHVTSSVHNPYYDQMIKDFWKYLDTNDRYKVLRRYHILGGEPFLLDELDQSIDFWNNHPNPDLTFSIITNLNIPTARFESYIKKFEKLVLSGKIWKLQITASLDCWAPQQEYIRYGLKLAQWERNFELLLNKPWIKLSINSAISALSIKHLPELIKKINHWNTFQTIKAGRWEAEPILHSFGPTGVDDHPYIFGAGVFDQDFETVINLMSESTEFQIGQKKVMQGIAMTQQSTPRNLQKIQSLKDYLDSLDQRRNTDWRAQFPWLNQEFKL